MSFIDSQLARMLLADEEMKNNDAEEEKDTLMDASQKYVTGYIPEDGMSGKNSAASGRVK